MAVSFLKGKAAYLEAKLQKYEQLRYYCSPVPALMPLDSTIASRSVSVPMADYEIT